MQIYIALNFLFNNDEAVPIIVIQFAKLSSYALVPFG